MNRIKQAWLALCGRLEPEVREVEKRVEVEVPIFGDAQEVVLYRARDPLWSINRFSLFAHGMKLAEWDGRMFHTCEQAFAECPGAEVESVKLWRIGGKHFESPVAKRVTIQPKPKRPKGKAR